MPKYSGEVQFFNQLLTTNNEIILHFCDINFKT